MVHVHRKAAGSGAAGLMALGRTIAAGAAPRRANLAPEEAVRTRMEGGLVVVRHAGECVVAGQVPVQVRAESGMIPTVGRETVTAGHVVRATQKRAAHRAMAIARRSMSASIVWSESWMKSCASCAG
jgi:hypothetical protein